MANWGSIGKAAGVGGAGAAAVGGAPLPAAAYVQGNGSIPRGLENMGDKLGFGTDRQKQAGKRAEYEAQERQRQASEQRQQELAYSTEGYRNKRNPLTENYAKTYQDAANESRRYQSETENQANDARTNYTNVLAPNMQSYLDHAKSEAGSAMTLQEAGDINNKINRETRAFYEQQAQGEGRRGLADTGVLQALGSQATASQIGGSGVPLTGGQLVALQGANQSQAGQAYANVQKRIQNLRDQGVETGMKRSDDQYARGQKATDRYSGAINQSSDVSGKYNALMSGLRDQASGYGTQGYSADLAGLDQRTGDAREDYGIDTNLNALKYGDINSYIAQLQASANRDIVGGEARTTANRNIGGSLAGAGIKAAAAGGGAA